MHLYADEEYNLGGDQVELQVRREVGDRRVPEWDQAPMILSHSRCWLSWSAKTP
jgi:hypothetical protein